MMKTSQLLRKLTQAGCYVVRHGGNHDIWFSPTTKLKCPVPRHGSREASRKTYDSILERLLGL